MKRHWKCTIMLWSNLNNLFYNCNIILFNVIQGFEANNLDPTNPAADAKYPTPLVA